MKKFKGLVNTLVGEFYYLFTYLLIIIFMFQLHNMLIYVIFLFFMFETQSVFWDNKHQSLIWAIHFTMILVLHMALYYSVNI